MSLATFIVAKLRADTTVAAAVGQKIFAVVAPQDTPAPFVTFEEFEGDRFSDMGKDADIADARVRLHIFSPSKAAADALATACRKALQRYRGSAYGATTIDDIFVIAGGPTLYDEPTRLYHLVRDFRVIYRDA